MTQISKNEFEIVDSVDSSFHRREEAIKRAKNGASK
jgi:hypothetical protein